MTEATAELPIEDPKPQGRPTNASPLAAAQAEQRAADAEVERLTEQIKALAGEGPGSDPAARARLDGDRNAALKTLRHADLGLAEQTAAVGAPISARVLDKIRRQRRKVEYSHGAVLAGMAENRRVRERKNGLENEIAALKNSGGFRDDERELRSQYVWGRGAQEPRDPPPPARSGAKSPQSQQNLARLEVALDVTAAELKITQAAQVAASEKWQNAKLTLDAWEAAIRALGPAARSALAAIPQAGVHDDQGLKGYADISLQTPHHLHESIKHFGRS